MTHAMERATGMILALAGCASTEPGEPYALPDGRYRYAMEYRDGAVAHRYAGDLLISQSSPFRLTYTWDVPGYHTQILGEYAYSSEKNPWFMSAYILEDQRTALNTITRAGNGYRCTVRIVDPELQYRAGACSVSYAGPDSAQAAPR